ncbi:hypothetical protein CC80DRAFT_595284 [Byssothecium circinans]|uniref:Uncharacterized protein n=1 Tax=Byssothecium circinans TaxID=147558 RepID=A0A6A5TTW9_9PLEO|nr:hypothetical protein CC80DRAFT_595284 [Byssothecium circinans]
MSRISPPSDTSSTTLPSFYDDGRDIQDRMPATPPPAPEQSSNLQHWLNGESQASVTTASVPSASVYTGSYIDDGADLFLPYKNAPVIGQIDQRFYQKGHRIDPVDEVEWSKEVQKAVCGDIGRSLDEMMKRSNLRVVDTEEDEKGSIHLEEKEEEDPYAVKITVPRMFGTFIISGEDGRVIVVDEDGEFDSGLPQERIDWDKVEKERFAENEEDQKRAKEKTHRKGRKRYKAHKKHHRAPSLPSLPLSTVLEAIDSEDETSVATPTKLFFPDKTKGWPSPQRSPAEPTPVPASNTFSPPGAWPSPLLSPIKPSLASSTKIDNSWSQNKDDAWEAPISPTKPTSAIGSEFGYDYDAKDEPSHFGYDQQNSLVREVSPVGSDGNLNENDTTVPWDKPLASRATSRRSGKSSAFTSSDAVPESFLHTEMWNQDTQATGSPIKHPSSGISSRNPRKSASSISSAVIPSPWLETGTYNAGVRVKTLSSSTSSEVSGISSSKPPSITSWMRDVDEFDSRVPHKGSSVKASSIGSATSWGGVGEHRPTNSPLRSVGSRDSSTASKNSWGGIADNRSTHSSQQSHRSRASSILKVKTPWSGEEDKNSSPSSQTTAIRRPPSVVGSQSQAAWDKPFDTTSVRSNGSGKSVVQPFSWHRDVDRESTYSEVGSSLSRVLSDAGSKLSFNDNDDMDTKSTSNRSTGSHVTYRAPFVEDAGETSADEKPGWLFDNTTSTSPQKSSAKGGRSASSSHEGSLSGSKKGSDSGWNTQTQRIWSPRASDRGSGTSWGGSQRSRGSGRSGTGAELGVREEWQDRSGFDEDNETWLNAETPGGVRYRQTDWGEWSTTQTVKDV